MSQAQFLIGRCGLDLKDFYPDDLPSEWRFDYYAHFFKALLLRLDTDENLPEILQELQATEDEFELVLSINKTQLTDLKSLSKRLAKLANYQKYFTLFCEIDATPTPTVMDLLGDYKLCFQSENTLKLGLKSTLMAGKYLSFNHCPVVCFEPVLEDKQIPNILEEMALARVKTIFIYPSGEQQALDKIRIIAELLGY